jgi:hypothetical protein
METNAVWAFEQDIKSRTLLDWIIAHTSFMKPLHRFEGQMTVHADRLQFHGKDRRRNEEVDFQLFKHQIDQFYLGFDETFSAFETRGLGLGWQPLRINFSQQGQENKLYLIVNYQFGFSDNSGFFEYLKEWVRK